MTPDAIDLFLQYFPFTPTQGQKLLFEKMGKFLEDEKTDRPVFLLKGYAGTGKTSSISALVQVLRHFYKKPVLMAPTGRAAKVMSTYSKKRAFTIHKIIFKQAEDPKSGRFFFKRQRNTSKNTLFIVDEASMIDNVGGGFNRRGLLDEMVDYIFEDPDSGNKLLLVGDTAQLPPVNQEISPALDVTCLERDYQLRVTAHLLTDVVRQKEASGILENATNLRVGIAKKQFAPAFRTKKYKDIYRMTSEKLEDGLIYAYNKYGVENTTIICRSNRNATHYNNYIRQQILYKEAELDAGDFLMIVRNNYFWLSPESQAGFLANGEFVEVMGVGSVEEMYGFRFMDLRLRLIDYPDEPAFTAKVMLDTLHSFTPALSQEENTKLYETVLAEYADAEDQNEQMEMMRSDPYLNALQVKFAYALTCHKSQGSQWNTVFVDIGYLKEEMMNVELMRWLYTAVTRATHELYLVNFSPKFFGE